MTALGSLLLQPQALNRFQAIAASGNAGKALGDDLLAVLQQIAMNPAQAEAILPALKLAFADCTQQLRQQMEPRLNAALAEINTILAPLFAQLNSIGTEATNLNTVGDALDVVGSILDVAVQAINALSQEQIAQFSSKIDHLLSDTLGLSQSQLQQLLRQIFATTRQHLLAGTNAMSEQTAGVRFGAAAVIGRLEREILSELPTLPFDTNRIAEMLMQSLRRSGFEKIREKLQQVLESVRAMLGATTALIDLARPSGFGGGSIGAGAVRPPVSGDTYCWYASWLYRTLRRDGGGMVADALLPGYPTDEVWVSEDKTQLILRRAFNDDVVLFEDPAGNVQWTDAPMFKTASAEECFTFKFIPADAMETWTQVAYALVAGVKTGSHIIDFATQPKSYGVNIPMTFWHLANMLSASFARAPFPSFLTAASGLGLGSQWMYVLYPLASVTLGSLEGIHTKTNGTNKFLQWITLLGGDALSANNHAGLPNMVNELILCMFTLLNYDGPSSPPDGPDLRPKNRTYFTPFVTLFVGVANIVMLKLVPRKDYAHPFHPDNKMFYAWWAVSIGMGITGGILGTFTGWAFTRSYDWKDFGEQIGWGALKGPLFFLLQWYTTKEGDTNGGKYNPKPGGDFAGYPDAATSPYKLPYPRGTSQFVGQANQGMFSHMAFNYLPQVYAYDFAHDFGEDICACRGGTVVDYFDWIVDDINPDATQQQTAATLAAPDIVAGQTTIDSWNFIMIRHDDVNNDHDKEAGGNVVTTYAVYGHGKQGSVREAFAARSVTAQNIIGTVVQQGQVIMKGGDVGMSFHNHLHMHVVVVDPAKPVTDPISTRMRDYTIPFVFREAKHIIGTDGVLKYLTWYTSDNEVV